MESADIPICNEPMPRPSKSGPEQPDALTDVPRVTTLTLSARGGSVWHATTTSATSAIRRIRATKSFVCSNLLDGSGYIPV